MQMQRQFAIILINQSDDDWQLDTYCEDKVIDRQCRVLRRGEVLVEEPEAFKVSDGRNNRCYGLEDRRAERARKLIHRCLAGEVRIQGFLHAFYISGDNESLW